MHPRENKIRRFLVGCTVLLFTCISFAGASVTLFLEEPYGKLGFFTATGHAAVYLPGVCAETPVKLRPCRSGETGVVLSRYDGVDGYDWVAIPLIPYLYAVERPEDVPLMADSKMVFFLRDRYRRKYLEEIAPDKANGDAPGGNWYELVGSSYDRTIYGFDIETTPEQDLALIHKLNRSANESHFHLASRNCADFAKDILNFYFPQTFHRSVIADVGITTPKQIAKLLTRYSVRHPELQFSRLVIAQIPGGMPRSTPVHGVVESFLKSKKYIVPSAFVSPIFAGCVAAVYVGTGGTRIHPGRDAMVYVVGGNPEPPLGKEDRKAYQEQLRRFLAGAYPDNVTRKANKEWEKLQSKAIVGVDHQGQPILQMETDAKPIEVGVAADNVLKGNASPALVQQLLTARLQSVLYGKASHNVSESEVARDLKLLEQSMAHAEAPKQTIANGARPEAPASSRSEMVRGGQR